MGRLVAWSCDVDFGALAWLVGRSPTPCPAAERAVSASAVRSRVWNPGTDAGSEPLTGAAIPKMDAKR